MKEKLMSLWYDKEKGLETLLYIIRPSSRVHMMYNTLKVIYIADRKHLERYGRQINGDSYFCPNHGVTPIESYDMIKWARGDGKIDYGKDVKTSIVCDCYSEHILPNRSPNMDYLSLSDIECLDEAIEEVGLMCYCDLFKYCRDEVYHSVELNAKLPLENIILTLNDGKNILTDLKTYIL